MSLLCLIYELFGCYFARLQIKAAGISASWLSSRGPLPFTEIHWRVQRRHSCCQTHRHSSQYSFSSSFNNFIHDLELMACRHAKSKLLWKNKSGYCGLISTTVSFRRAPCLTSRPGSDSLTEVLPFFFSSPNKLRSSTTLRPRPLLSTSFLIYWSIIVQSVDSALWAIKILDT